MSTVGSIIAFLHLAIRAPALLQLRRERTARIKLVIGVCLRVVLSALVLRCALRLLLFGLG